MSADKPGIVFVKTASNDQGTEVSVLRNHDVQFGLNDKPAIIDSAGLTRQRQQYLYSKVRPYVREMHQEAMCPRVPEEWTNKCVYLVPSIYTKKIRL